MRRTSHRKAAISKAICVFAGNLSAQRRYSENLWQELGLELKNQPLQKAKRPRQEPFKTASACYK